MPARRGRHVACALCLAVVACQGIDEAPETSVVDAGHSFIRFQHADFDADLSEYSVDRYRRSGNEYHTARFYGMDGFAMLAAYKTSPGYVMRERPSDAHIADMLEGMAIDWGESGRTASGFGPVPYRLFALPDGPFSCVGFSQTVGETADDRGRKSDLVVGFFCRDETRPMSTDAAEELIGKVSLAGRR